MDFLMIVILKVKKGTALFWILSLKLNRAIPFFPEEYAGFGLILNVRRTYAA